MKVLLLAVLLTGCSGMQICTTRDVPHGGNSIRTEIAECHPYVRPTCPPDPFPRNMTRSDIHRYMDKGPYIPVLVETEIVLSLTLMESLSDLLPTKYVRMLMCTEEDSSSSSSSGWPRKVKRWISRATKPITNLPVISIVPNLLSNVVMVGKGSLGLNDVSNRTRIGSSSPPVTSEPTSANIPAEGTEVIASAIIPGAEDKKAPTNQRSK